jgi:tight adherence protein B
VNPVIFVGVTFVVVLGMILGAYWLLVAQPEDREQSKLRKRLRPQGRIKALGGSEGLLKEAQKLSTVQLVDAVLRRSGALSGPLQRLIAQAGLRTNVSVILLACGCLGMGVALVVTLMSRWFIGVPLGVVAALLPIFVLRFKRDRRVLKFEEQFPEAIDLIARALRAGHAFTTGLSMVAD